MCGFVGIFDTRGGREIDSDLLHRMNESQFHRGPDEGGVHIEGGIGLGHRRLSIIDLSSGQQPLYNEDKSVVVVYNGEIYNFPELSEELKGCGHQFRTHCDTEVIVHAWEEWGDKCVDHFRGMFAFALWDRNRQSLFLARDRLGIKPLFYAYLPDGYLIFGSELKALQTHPGLDKALDPLAIEDYFSYGYIPDPRTIYRNANKLPSGHYLNVSRDVRSELKQYWDVPFSTQASVSEDDIKEELMVRFKEAVDIRLIAEVPLGAFLSGGVDSSAVVALMSGISPDPVNTFSISFGDPKYNESAYAAQVASQYLTNHRVAQVDPDDFDLIDQLAGLYDEPYADSSAMPTYRVCELARKNVTVALSGDGGDENLAGYRRYRWHMNEERIRGVMPLSLRKPLFGFASRIYPKADWAPRVFRAKSTFQGMARDSVNAYFHTISIFTDEQRKSMFSPGFQSELQGYQGSEVLRKHAEQSPTDHPLSLVQYLDFKTYLPGDILTKVDRASMAHSLEVRVPLLDHKLVEWISSLPPELKLKGGSGKDIFKSALEPHLPKEILYRSKMGFAVPLSSWFRGPLRKRVQDALLGERLANTGLFNRTFLESMVKRHQSGTSDFSPHIWSLLMFEAFLAKSL
jgi:asparagine synthase (glutamine-hydrolysing)